MSIQGNVNQIVSLAALVATQTPAFKAAAEKRQQLGEIKREEKVLGQREAVAQAKGGSTYNIKQEQADLAYRKYRTSPSVKTAEAAEKAGEIAEEARLDQPSSIEGFATVREEEEYAAAQEQLYEEMAQEQYEDMNEAAAARNMADSKLAEQQEAKRQTNMRKMGYQTPSIRSFADMNRKEKKKINTQLEIMEKEGK